MSEQVKVTSIDALEAFRANLIVFLTKAHQSIDEVSDAIRRTRNWVQHDQRVHWEGEIRRRREIRLLSEGVTKAKPPTQMASAT